MVKLRQLAIELTGFSLGRIDLNVQRGECFVLLGPTGSGKTLTLEAIAGILPISHGRIWINGTDVTRLPPEKRGIGIVYQDFALFPHLSVIENVTYGLRYCRKPHRPSRKRIDELMALTGIDHLSRRDVNTLSGGEKQRVALVRALSVNPSVLLLDEPLSALDRGIRYDIQKLLKSLHRETGTTFLMVTHDFTEAIFLGQRAAVLNNGRIEQAGPIMEILRHPKSPFVAKFVGIPNVFPANFEDNHAVMDGFALKLAHPPSEASTHIAIRPEDIRIHPARPEAPANILTGKVIDMADHGPYGEITVETAAATLKATLPRRELLEFYNLPPGEVFLQVPPDGIHTF
ncbi:MAG: ABC transporter ATP-binding protein [Desulfobacterales bacterium]|nr:ABC transporter ATP-binding protein [Desulfobacterales bacterium]